ncbi:MAG: selenocysteine-specific translation elongation factor [Gemmatimonadetes bacterium 13_2_20CM_2_65_7]|nr:MAG: selenocysteine-specific translation elongation factor [Gemmatimonadetes bacterium 13_2_20CM_2_65_7]
MDFRRFVVGTAGHIDHGKTALVKALTGVDTDRWEEEKRRGITIDLGFAPLPLANGIQASVVDVPGHEGFVRNMLAGATGIDVALLVIAADEGIMPQTEEHLAIVELLGVRRGIPVLTKRDLVDAEWLGMVRTEVAERLSRSRVRWHAPLAVSALSGEGLDELRTALVAIAADLADRPVDDLFRLPIDRVFALAGAGTVVTGSTWSGTVEAGASVRLLPLGREVRVRSIEVHGEETDRAAPGRRTALALVGADKEELERGHVALTGAGWAPTTALDVALELLPSVRRPLAARTRIRVHLGTAEVLGRVAQVRSIAPGESGVARLLLEHSIVARGRDRFVIRSFSPVTTIGGGVVLDPFPPQRPRVSERGLTAGQPPGELLARLVEEAGLAGVRIADLPVRLGILPAEVPGTIAAAGKGVLAVDDILVARRAVSGEVERLAKVVAAHHEEHPLDPGLSLQSLRAAVNAPAAVLDLLIEHGMKKQSFERTEDGAAVRKPGWKAALRERAGDAGGRLAQRLAEAKWQLPTVAELQKELGDPTVPALLAHLAREGSVERVDQERYALKQALDDFRRAVEDTLRELGAATPAQFRDRLGLTRKYLIPLLEWADRRGITSRKGDTRVLRA